MDVTHNLDVTILISSSMFPSLHSPTESHISTIDPPPPTITSTPLSSTGLQQGQTSSDYSQPSLASLYSSPNFNALGYQTVVPGSMMPSVTSIVSSHHVSSTWFPGAPVPGAPPLHLTIDQTQSIF